MKLLTKELEKQFEKIGSQEDSEDPLIIARFFNPMGQGTWLATEYDPVDKIFFGYANILEGEWGSFSLDELESVKLIRGLGIERDLYWKPKRFSECFQYDK